MAHAISVVVEMSVARVGIIGDVHTEAEALSRALEYLSQSDVEVILCTGDLADGPGDATDLERCCELLVEHDVVTICGNHDRWLHAHEMRDLHDATDPDDLRPEVLEQLARFPTTIDVTTTAGTLLLCHGMGPDDMAELQPHDHGPALGGNSALQEVLGTGRYSIVVAGHTHRRMVRVIGGVVFINAGTLHPKHHPCFGIIDLASMRLDFIGVEADGKLPLLESLPLLPA